MKRYCMGSDYRNRTVVGMYGPAETLHSQWGSTHLASLDCHGYNFILCIVMSPFDCDITMILSMHI